MNTYSAEMLDLLGVVRAINFAAEEDQSAHWITMKNKEGAGTTHVKIDGGGNIEAGPKSLEGQNVEHLQKHPLYDKKTGQVFASKGKKAAKFSGGDKKAASGAAQGAYYRQKEEKLKQFGPKYEAELKNVIARETKKGATFEQAYKKALQKFGLKEKEPGSQGDILATAQQALQKAEAAPPASAKVLPQSDVASAFPDVEMGARARGPRRTNEQQLESLVNRKKEYGGGKHDERLDAEIGDRLSDEEKGFDPEADDTPDFLRKQEAAAPSESPVPARPSGDVDTSRQFGLFAKDKGGNPIEVGERAGQANLFNPSKYKTAAPEPKQEATPEFPNYDPKDTPEMFPAKGEGAPEKKPDVVESVGNEYERMLKDGQANAEAQPNSEPSPDAGGSNGPTEPPERPVASAADEPDRGDESPIQPGGAERGDTPAGAEGAEPAGDVEQPAEQPQSEQDIAQAVNRGEMSVDDVLPTHPHLAGDALIEQHKRERDEELAQAEVDKEAAEHAMGSEADLPEGDLPDFGDVEGEQPAVEEPAPTMEQPQAEPEGAPVKPQTQPAQAPRAQVQQDVRGALIAMGMSPRQAETLAHAAIQMGHTNVADAIIWATQNPTAKPQTPDDWAKEDAMPTRPQPKTAAAVRQRTKAVPPPSKLPPLQHQAPPTKIPRNLQATSALAASKAAHIGGPKQKAPHAPALPSVGGGRAAATPPISKFVTSQGRSHAPRSFHPEMPSGVYEQPGSRGPGAVHHGKAISASEQRKAKGRTVEEMASYSTGDGSESLKRILTLLEMVS